MAGQSARHGRSTPPFHHSDLILRKPSLAEGRIRSACRRWPARRI